MPLHACFARALPLRPASCSSTATCALARARVVPRACAERVPDAQRPPPSTASTELAAAKPAPLASRNDVPAIFNGPEAVLAVLLAAAALLTDFVRNVVRLSSASKRTLDLSAAESSVAELKEALRIGKEVLDETERRLNVVPEQRADAHHLRADADRVRQKMQSANLRAQRAEQQLQSLQRALRDVQQKRLHVAQEQERVDEERQRVEAQIADKWLLVDKLSEQIESAKNKEREIREQVEYQQQLLDKQLDDARKKLSDTAGDMEKEQLNVRGGDSARSERSLQEIKRNLRSEQLALSAELREAQVASEALSGEQVDELQLLKREMKAKQDGMRARLSKAQTTVDREEKEIQRREDAISEVLESVAQNTDENVVMEGVDGVEGTDVVKKRVRRARKKQVVSKDVPVVGESEVPAKKQTRGRKRVAKDEAVEETLSTATQVGVNVDGGAVDTGESEATETKQTRGKKSVAKDEAVEQTLSTATQVGLDADGGAVDAGESEATATKQTKRRRNVAKDKAVEETLSTATQVGINVGGGAVDAGESKAAARKQTRGRRSVAKDKAVEKAPSSVYAAEKDGLESEDDKAEATSTSDAKEVKKRRRTRKRAGSGGSSSSTRSDSTSSSSSTAKAGGRRKKRPEVSVDGPLTAEEAMGIREAMMDTLAQEGHDGQITSGGAQAAAGSAGSGETAQAEEK